MRVTSEVMERRLVAIVILLLLNAFHTICKWLLNFCILELMWTKLLLEYLLQPKKTVPLKICLTKEYFLSFVLKLIWLLVNTHSCVSSKVKNNIYCNHWKSDSIQFPFLDMEDNYIFPITVTFPEFPVIE